MRSTAAFVAALAITTTAAPTADNFHSVTNDWWNGNFTNVYELAQQRLAGLPQTGITDFATWQAIVAAYQTALVEVEPAAPLDIVMNPNQVILEGSDNLHILLIQAMLQALHEVYGNLEPCGLTGVCDRGTVRAVKCLQRCCGLPESGILDKGLWQLLAGLYHQAVGDGDRASHCGKKED